jgi:hypothetical protein
MFLHEHKNITELSISVACAVVAVKDKTVIETVVMPSLC